MPRPRPIPAPVTRPDPHRAPLRAGADPQRRDEAGDPPLHYAANCGIVVWARALLAAGVDPNRKDRVESVPIGRAVYLPRPDMLLLLAAGADPNRQRPAQHPHPMDVARRRRELRRPGAGKIVELLQATVDHPQNAPRLTP